jgi:hypothetical protein
MRTTVKHPDGTETKVRSSLGCSGCFWVPLLIFVIMAPASFPLPLAILAYSVEAGLGYAWLKRGA